MTGTREEIAALLATAGVDVRREALADVLSTLVELAYVRGRKDQAEATQARFAEASQAVAS